MVYWKGGRLEACPFSLSHEANITMYSMSYEFDPQKKVPFEAIAATEGVYSVRITYRTMGSPTWMGAAIGHRNTADRLNRDYIEIEYDGLEPNKTLKELIAILEANN